MGKNYFLILFLLLEVIFLISCNDDDSLKENAENNKKLLVSRMNSDSDGYFNLYYYDSKNRIVKVDVRQGGLGSRFENYEYDSNDNPIKKTISFSSGKNIYHTTYSYKEDSVFITEHDVYPSMEVDTLIIDTRGNIKKNGDVTFTINNLECIAGVQYELASSNIPISSAVTYSYDDKKGAFSGMNAKQWFVFKEMNKEYAVGSNLTNISNPLTVISTNNNWNSVTNEGYMSYNKSEYTYTYNAEGYPLTILKKYIGDDGNEPEYQSYSLEYIEAK